jgi:hypothetical protein
MKGFDPWPQKLPLIAFLAVPAKLNVQKARSLKVQISTLLILPNAPIVMPASMYALLALAFPHKNSFLIEKRQSLKDCLFLLFYSK